jgi:hypothetical protein
MPGPPAAAQEAHLVAKISEHYAGGVACPFEADVRWLFGRAVLLAGTAYVAYQLKRVRSDWG